MLGIMRTLFPAQAVLLSTLIAATALAADPAGPEAHRRGGRGGGGRWEGHHPRGPGHGWEGHHHRRRGKFLLSLGICAGQKLAKAGITLPERKPGERLDEATRKAVWENVGSCKEEFRARWEERRRGRGGRPGEKPAGPGENPDKSGLEEDAAFVIDDLAD